MSLRKEDDPVTSIEEMQNHIAALCESEEIICHFIEGDDAWGSYWAREIEIPPIVDECSYATALHEIGHVLGRHQLSEVILVRERWAWKWARRNALEWTSPMQRHSEMCLEYSERTPNARSSTQIERIDPSE